MIAWDADLPSLCGIDRDTLGTWVANFALQAVGGSSSIDGLQKLVWLPGKLSLVGCQPQLTLQPFLNTFQGSAGLRQAVAGLNILQALCGVAPGQALA